MLPPLSLFQIMRTERHRDAIVLSRLLRPLQHVRWAILLPSYYVRSAVTSYAAMIRERRSTYPSLAAGPVFPMLSSKADSLILVLFVFTMGVVSLLLLLQICTVCFLRRSADGSAQAREGGARLQEADAAGAAAGPGLGLGAAAVASLPVLLGDGSSGDGEPGDCVVCLSALEADGEGRVLPLCGHAFHAGCIGRWLGSHSVCCPICRTPVRTDPESSGAADPGVPLLAAAGSRAGVEVGGDVVDELFAASAVSAAIEEHSLPLLLLY
ncbi:hypothetical protein Taro_020126 [Colocasia esculenta]|uniref:RING-type domain-containing protein n=1 Tax=Colocasia esculenta TaxID=4460 RepID=A0A843UMU8_COLES|nr:hypothetical protein [Colocasia esculenta]